MKLLNLVLSLIIGITSIVLCHEIVINSITNQASKYDYAELNHVKYGLLSIEEWKKQITVIIADEIGKFDLSKRDKKYLRRHIEVLLNEMIDKVAKQIKEGNSGSVEGWVKQSLINIFVNLEDIKKGVPKYADAVVGEMTKTKTKIQIKTMLSSKLRQYSDQTFGSQDTEKMNRILLRAGAKDIESARINLNRSISVKHNLICREAALLIVLSVVLFLSSGFSKQLLVPSRYLSLLLSLAMLLVAGVTTSMIDMEARISDMSIVLIGHPIHFENQVLYFQSKSILDVFWIMITHDDIKMKFVGILLVLFSVVFPVCKIIASIGCYYNSSYARNSMANFFVLKSGKWSMADVMVVSIFMAYIGFNGMIASEFSKLGSAGQELVILATNGTSLQPGYYLFLTYTLLALFLSGFLTRRPSGWTSAVRAPLSAMTTSPANGSPPSGAQGDPSADLNTKPVDPSATQPSAS